MSQQEHYGQQGSHGNGGGEFPLDAPAELPLPPLPRPPFWMIAVALVAVVFTWVPLALIAKARTYKSSEPRIQIMQDMGVQPKYREQQTNHLFADDRAMRPKIPGTVSQTDLEDDDTYYHGFTRMLGADGSTTVQFATALPAQVPLTMDLLKHGQQRFNIYCFPCHGMDGSGHGPVNQRAMELQINGQQGMKWTQAADLTSGPIRIQPDGKIFNTITNGIRNMPSYSGQISVPDRWAIVAYVRALQFSQNAPLSAVPEDQRQAHLSH
ncbi:MAG: cytochrome c [Planctomycetota bacterium]|nr:cytochrome c [Planctomycetota bacterium]